MILSFYFFRQMIPSFLFGVVLFIFVLILDKFFDLIDLIFNKGVSLAIVGKMFLLFMPTIAPLSIPMAILLACVVTFGRLAEENELIAVRTGGLSLLRVFWLPPLFALLVSLCLVPFNTELAPRCSKIFRSLFEEIVRADPLINIEPRRFFSIKNIKIYTEAVDKKSNTLQNVLVYQNTSDGRPKDRIFARTGQIQAENDLFLMTLSYGQLQRYDSLNPQKVVHINFKTYQLRIPLNAEKEERSVRFRSLTSRELKNMIADMKKQGLVTHGLQAENSLRHAVAFAPLALLFMGLPLATVLRKGGRTFSLGLTMVVLFTYYLLLIFGLTMAEKGILPPSISLWMANVFCFGSGSFLFYRLLRR